MPESEEQEHGDWELVKRAKTGEEAAFASLISRYQHPIHSFIFRSVGQEALAADLAQEVFVKAWFALPSVRPSGKFSSWLFQIAVNLCRDHFRSKAARQGLVTESMDFDQADSSPAPDTTVEQREAVERLEGEIRSLPAKLREPFLLAAVEGYSQKEVGEILRLSAKAVEVRIYRARKLLADKIGRFLGKQD